MGSINQRANSLFELSSLLQNVRSQLAYHTESGFTGEEANSYAEQIDDVQEILVPQWRKRLKGTSYAVDIQCVPTFGGFLKIKVERAGTDPIEVFSESYARFNSEMFDGSCHQYLYQRVLCYEDDLACGRVSL